MAKAKYTNPKAQLKKWISLRKLVLPMLLIFTIVLLVLLSIGVFNLPITANDSPIKDLGALRRRRTSERGYGLVEQKKKWTEILSWEPRAFMYHNFLSKEECEHLINVAKPHMEKSQVADSDTGQSIDSSDRTSSGAFLRRGLDKIVQSIEKKIADLTFVPIDVEEGGETVFPDANVSFSSVPWQNDLSECAKNGLAVKPKMGDAILFWSMKPDLTLDPSSLHGSCPVIRGNKWASAKWLRLGVFN
ncbi:probable prolyl 4-hydroxylase 3 isoform X3 [Arachis ipaensis]|uniref:probable prolyl 4-hydroxylase 3 isoform X3 n=1 Tax=Arachis ipaensis TaxID=130454 RepID=UPI000A2B86C2|nr:probable prolyl 4-hydroxylase 3 isoform X3 [Arachis ipaensis]XP_029147478.1 probable prolyl 4-hydroxylase 3 isoform X2 [Arachis hypogaea]